MLSFCFIFVCLFAGNANSLPYYMLTSTRTKCFSVSTPPSETIVINYNAPDIRIPDDDSEARAEKDDLARRMKALGKDGVDEEYKKRMQNNYQTLKGHKMRDMSITVTQKNTNLNRNSIPSAKDGRARGADSATFGHGRKREELIKRKGTFEFQTSADDGSIVDICVQSIVASKDNPVRVHLSVIVDEESAGVEENEGEEKDTATTAQALEAKVTMTRIEKDMLSMTNRARTILRSADMNKEQEIGFHDQSIAMNAAASYWPIIRLVLLFVTGFVQVNHIISFMKNRHIGF